MPRAFTPSRLSFDSCNGACIVESSWLIFSWSFALHGEPKIMSSAFDFTQRLSCWAAALHTGRFSLNDLLPLGGEVREGPTGCQCTLILSLSSNVGQPGHLSGE
jgi:hypothetical protein